MGKNRDMIRVTGLTKEFELHNQGGVRLPVLQGVDIFVERGECVVLYGPSGAGKSSLLRSMYANYKPQHGKIEIWHDDRWVDLLSAPSQEVLEIRKRTLGYVSQFLRVIPRVPTLDVVAEPLRRLGADMDSARTKAKYLLQRLHIPERLWALAPATFSGGEQQRVNIARGFIAEYPVMLLDEPTASLDAANRGVVMELIEEAKKRGAALVGIFHDEDVRGRVGNRIFEMATSGKA